jgi:hypothetical protein
MLATIRHAKNPIRFELDSSDFSLLIPFSQHMDEVLTDFSQNEKIGFSLRTVWYCNVDNYKMVEDSSDSIFLFENSFIYGKDMLIMAHEYAQYAADLPLTKLSRKEEHYFCELKYFYFPIDAKNSTKNTLIYDSIDVNHTYAQRTKNENQALIALAIEVEKRVLEKQILPTQESIKNKLKV